MTAVLNSEEGETEKIAITIKECKRIGIQILPPNVNYSMEKFSIIKGKDGKPDAIVFGLNTVKNLGSDAVKEIVKERNQGGKFKAIAEFIKRVPGKSLNKKSIEALVKSGSLDDLESRDVLLGNIETLLGFQHQVHGSHKHEVSLFDTVDDFEELHLVKSPPVERNLKLLWERELVGLYLTGHPLDPWKSVLENRDITISKINTELGEGRQVIFAGIIGSVKNMLTKNKDKMAFLDVQDLDSSIEVIVFPKTYAQFKDLILQDTPLAFKGRISMKNKDSDDKNEDGSDKTEEEKNKYGAKAIILEEIRRI
jgi:DNA polymerase-3 subunit alpha